MRSVRIVRCEENLDGRLLSERVRGLSDANAETRGVPMARASPVLGRMIEKTTVRNLPPTRRRQSRRPGFV